MCIGKGYFSFNIYYKNKMYISIVALNIIDTHNKRNTI